MDKLRFQKGQMTDLPTQEMHSASTQVYGFLRERPLILPCFCFCPASDEFLF